MELLKKNEGELQFHALPISQNRWEGEDYILIEHLLGIKEKEGIMEMYDYFRI
ncbi:hypothetical protein P9858_17240 [Niallia circulans]|uniref:hypothetical protein n=1 Tax=Niallia circulans TaxID=1397 RepID=UPI002E1BD6C3|nr:hypothetical protein [Niallia circulans]